MSMNNPELRERAILPILVPLSAIVATEVIVFSMSRVLLTAGKQGAVVVALGTSLAIVIGAAFIAARPRIKSASIIGLLAILGLGSVAAGALAMQRGAFYEREAAASLPHLEVSAANLVFDTKTLELSAAGATIEFNNADTQPHNIAIYESADKLDSALFKGDIITAGASAAYEVPAIEPGAYYFQCDVHPTMKGEAVVEEGAGSPEHSGAQEG